MPPQTIPFPLAPIETIPCYCCKRRFPVTKLSECSSCNELLCGTAGCSGHCRCREEPISEIVISANKLDIDHICFCEHASGMCKFCNVLKAPVVNFVKDSRGRFLFVNEKGVNLYHQDWQKMIGRHVTDVLPLNIAACLDEQDSLIRVTGKSDTRIFEWVDDCTKQKVSWMVKKTLGKDGIIIGVAVDISAFNVSNDNHNPLVSMLTAQRGLNID